MCTVKPFTLGTNPDRMPAGIVELPYGGRLCAAAPTRAARDARVNPPTATAEALARNVRREYMYWTVLPEPLPAAPPSRPATRGLIPVVISTDPADTRR